MDEIKFWLDKNLDDAVRVEIINLKQQHWPYSFESQEKWMRDNIASDDIHFCLYHESILVSYLTLSNVEISINGSPKQRVLGMGNVCTGKKYVHQGFASELIKSAQKYVLEQGLGAIMLCHEELVSFYQRLNWTNITNQCKRIEVSGKLYSMILMKYNLTHSTENVIFEINKNF